MAKYRVSFRKSVAKDLRKLPNRDVRRSIQEIDRIAENPRSSDVKKLSGEDKYRARVGDYRTLFEIADEHLIITVVKVGHRRDVYR